MSSLRFEDLREEEEETEVTARLAKQLLEEDVAAIIADWLDGSLVICPLACLPRLGASTPSFEGIAPSGQRSASAGRTSESSV
ncbi:MAG: hypothetical protein M3R26_02350 [Actinomycetota bacterium]|nr:hypothetical protein [Actinomycetota bacterium]